MALGVLISGKKPRGAAFGPRSAALCALMLTSASCVPAVTAEAPGLQTTEALAAVASTVPGDVPAAAMPSTPGHVLLDLTRCDFIDSTALLVVVQAHRRALAGKHRLAIAGSGDQVRRVFELTELDTALPYFRDRESALRFLSRDDVER